MKNGSTNNAFSYTHCDDLQAISRGYQKKKPFCFEDCRKPVKEEWPAFQEIVQRVRNHHSLSVWCVYNGRHTRQTTNMHYLSSYQNNNFICKNGGDEIPRCHRITDEVRTTSIDNSCTWATSKLRKWNNQRHGRVTR